MIGPARLGPSFWLNDRLQFDEQLSRAKRDCFINKPKMANAPEGLNQVILRKVQRFLLKILKRLPKPLPQLITSSPSLMPTISTRCAFSYIAIWMRKPCDK